MSNNHIDEPEVAFNLTLIDRQGHINERVDCPETMAVDTFILLSDDDIDGLPAYRMWYGDGHSFYVTVEEGNVRVGFNCRTQEDYAYLLYSIDGLTEEDKLYYALSGELPECLATCIEKRTAKRYTF